MTKNTAAGFFALVLGAAYLIASFRLPEVTAGDEIGPKLFPIIIGVIVMLSGGALALSERRSQQKSPEAKKDLFSFRFVEERDTWVRIALTMICGIVYGLVLDWLGYVIATVFFMFFAASFINVRRHLENAIIAVSFSIVSFGAFAVLLKLSLPRGLLGFLPF